MGWGGEETLQGLHTPEVEVEKPLHVKRADARSERVRQGVDRKRKEVRGDGRGELREIVRRGERVDVDGADGCAREEDVEEWPEGRDVGLGREPVFGHGVDSVNERVYGWVVLHAGDVVDGVQDDIENGRVLCHGRDVDINVDVRRNSLAGRFAYAPFGLGEVIEVV